MNSLFELSCQFDIELVQPVAIGHSGLSDDLVAIVRGLPMDQYGEGIVVRFEDDGEMIKIKCDEYCLIHRAKERILDERYVVEDILNGDIDDVMATVLDADREKIERYRGEFWPALDEYVETLRQTIILRHRQFPDRKVYALSPEQRGDTRLMTQAIFWFYLEELSTEAVRQFVIDRRIRPALSTRTKFGEMKNEVFPNISFKY